jgi:thiol-disulfide isomerase/thioredoxin
LGFGILSIKLLTFQNLKFAKFNREIWNLEFKILEFKLKDMLIELNEDTLADLIAKDEKVVVQFSASWCGNCRIMKPKFKKLATENESITFALVDAENFPESRKLANVSNLPTFATFVNGKLVNETQTNKQEVLIDLVNEIV